MQNLVESLQKQLSLKDLLVEELTTGDTNETMTMIDGGAFSQMLHMPDSIEQMMDTLLANPQYTQIFLSRLNSASNPLL